MDIIVIIQVYIQALIDLIARTLAYLDVVSTLVS